MNGSMVRMALVGNYVCDDLKRVVALAEIAKSNEMISEPSGRTAHRPYSSIQRKPGSADASEQNCESDIVDKLFVFTCGSLTYTPHLIGFKLLRGREMKRRFGEEVMSQRRLTLIGQRLRILREQQEQGHIAASEDVPVVDAEPADAAQAHVDLNAAFLALFDTPDRTIDVRGHVTGMALSPDHRKLFFNVRPWIDQSLERIDPLDPPEISQHIELRVIDLENLAVTHSVLYYGHVGLTPASGCFFIFPAVSRDYVASGSEDNLAYLWDRRFGSLIKKLPHNSVVSAVALNPLFECNTRDEFSKSQSSSERCQKAGRQILVSASDDNTLKIWRSKLSMKLLGLI